MTIDVDLDVKQQIKTNYHLVISFANCLDPNKSGVPDLNQTIRPTDDFQKLDFAKKSTDVKH